MSLRLNGSTSGYVEIDAPAVAGTTSVTIPATTGELAVKATDGSVDLGGVNIDSSGRLLVGTASARTNFDSAFGGYASVVQVETATAGPTGLSIYNNNVSGYFPRLVLGISGGSSIGSNTIVANGNTLGIVSFQGSDGSKPVEAASIKAVVNGAPGTNDMPGALVFSTTQNGTSSPTERMRIEQNGRFTMGGLYVFTTAGAANVNVDSSGVVQRSTSSVKYKTNVETLQDSYSDAILNCRPVWYQSTCERDNPDWGWWGFIAEEVAEIDPRLVHWKTTEVTYDENGSAVQTPCEPEPEGVQYDRFVPHLLNLIKRQNARIETLEAEVQALKGGN